MRSEYGTHSLRQTKAAIVYGATGNLGAVQVLLGHAKIENTVRLFDLAGLIRWTWPTSAGLASVPWPTDAEAR